MKAPVNKKERGSVLATVVVIAAFLFLLTGVVYTYYRMNANTALYRMNRIRAQAAAESGIALAVHYLASLSRMPDTTEPFPVMMEGDSSGWTLLPWGQRCQIVIDPINGSFGELANGAAEIRARGISGSQTRSIYARVSPSYSSSYALLTSQGISEGFFTDGRVVNGPVHSNGPIWFTSYSPDSTGDPYVEMVSTTSQGGFIFSSSGRSEVPHPEGSNTWVRPYARLSQGRPFWRTSAPPVDLGRLGEHFRRLSSSTVSQTTVSVNAPRVIIDGDRLLYRTSETAPEEAVSIADADLIIIRNGFSSVILKTGARPGHPVTVLCPGDIHLGGQIDGGVPGSGGPMGIVSLGDIVIPADPDLTGTSDWPGRWQIETDGALMVRAALAIPYGDLQAQTPYLPSRMTRVTVSGSLTQVQMGRLSSANSGYELGISWDQGLGALHPPHFPMLGRWNVFSWLVDPPDQGDIDITDDLV